MHELVKACKKNDRQAQKALYQRYAPLFLSMCHRYFRKNDEAEDAMISAFFTIFKKISSYSGEGSFEGWMKRIVINTCLMALRKKKIESIPLENLPDHPERSPLAIDRLLEKDILNLLDYLPDGYRTVFNLYVIEGYKHREIAEMLDVSINTSKSQLIQARKRLAELIELNRQKDFGNGSS